MHPRAGAHPNVPDDNLGLVRLCIRRHFRDTPVRDDELVSAGALGLAKARASWVPERGPFGPYALIRIRGEIKDHLRGCDHLSRLQRRRARDTDDPFADPGPPMSFEASMVDVAWAEAHDHDEVVDRVALRDAVATALERLSRRDAAIVRLRFWGDRSLEEIGDVLGVSGSAISKALKQAFERLGRDPDLSRVAEALAGR